MSLRGSTSLSYPIGPLVGWKIAELRDGRLFGPWSRAELVQDGWQPATARDGMYGFHCYFNREDALSVVDGYNSHFPSLHFALVSVEARNVFEVGVDDTFYDDSGLARGVFKAEQVKVLSIELILRGRR